jgi:hypothetical protein
MSMTTLKSATFIRDIKGWTGTAKLYRVSPPMPLEKGGTADHVIVSATVAPYTGAETYIFPATADGQVIGWGELDGSYRGSLNHELALGLAGYEIAGSA